MSAFTLCLKCGTCVRRVFSLLLFGGIVILIGSDAISIMITWGQYDKAMTKVTGNRDDILAARFTYIGLNIVVIVMQTYIFLNAVYDIADHGDQAVKEEKARRAAGAETVPLTSTT